jgi:hypothetical protein
MIVAEIRREVGIADFYGHMVDETTDVSTKNQMSVVIRFVHEGEVKERFLGFSDVSDLSGEYYSVLVHIRLQHLATHNLCILLKFTIRKANNDLM